CFEEVPAPRTLAPFAIAVGAAVRVDGAEIATGRFVLLYDPDGQRGWGGPLRVIVYIRAELEPEIAEDPMGGRVAWAWPSRGPDGRLRGAGGHGYPGGHGGVRRQAGRTPGDRFRAACLLVTAAGRARRAAGGRRRPGWPGRAHGRVVRDDVRRGGAGAAGRGGQRAAPGQPPAEPMTGGRPVPRSGTPGGHNTARPQRQGSPDRP